MRYQISTDKSLVPTSTATVEPCCVQPETVNAPGVAFPGLPAMTRRSGSFTAQPVGKAGEMVVLSFAAADCAPVSTQYGYVPVEVYVAYIDHTLFPALSTASVRFAGVV